MDRRQGAGFDWFSSSDAIGRGAFGPRPTDRSLAVGRPVQRRKGRPARSPSPSGNAAGSRGIGTAMCGCCCTPTGAKGPRIRLMPTLEEYREMNSGLMTYYGTYDIDEAKQTVTHHLQAAANPSLMGTDLVRRYEFTGNRIALIFPGEAQRHVEFERVSDL